MSSNKILLISLDLPPLGGGQGVYVENIAKKLKKNSYNVTVLTTKSKYRKKNDFRVKEIFYSGQNPLVFVFLSYFYYLFNLKKENFTIIHGNSINHLIFLLFKHKDVKYFTTIHNTYLQRLKAKKNNFFYRLIYPLFINLEKIVLNKSNKIIAVSKSTENYVNKIINNKNILLIENGVNTEKFKPVIKNDFIFRFLYVGRLEPRKRVLETVKIFEQFLKKYQGNKKIEFIIVGRGSEYKKIKEYINTNKLKEVKLKEFSNNIKEYYDKSNCLLLLSRGEGLPLVLLEAISSGLGVIATQDASGLSKIVKPGDNGYIVKDELNKLEVINKMKESIKNFNKFSKKSRLIAISYDWNKVVDRYIEIYNS